MVIVRQPQVKSKTFSWHFEWRTVLRGPCGSWECTA